MTFPLTQTCTEFCASFYIYYSTYHEPFFHKRYILMVLTRYCGEESECLVLDLRNLYAIVSLKDLQNSI